MNDVNMNEATTETTVSSLVRINYKSSKSITAWFDKFDVHMNEGHVVGVSYQLSADQRDEAKIVKILSIGVHDIESVVQLG